SFRHCALNLRNMLILICLMLLGVQLKAGTIVCSFHEYMGQVPSQEITEGAITCDVEYCATYERLHPLSGRIEIGRSCGIECASEECYQLTDSKSVCCCKGNLCNAISPPKVTPTATSISSSPITTAAQTTRNEHSTPKSYQESLISLTAVECITYAVFIALFFIFMFYIIIILCKALMTIRLWQIENGQCPCSDCEKKRKSDEVEKTGATVSETQAVPPY
ncbi:hypothetical protein PMAYCL1PPCAC_04670, partial [Pristionchus mayeri]